MGWDTIASNFEGVTPLFLSKLFEHLAKCAAAKINSSELNGNTNVPTSENQNVFNGLVTITLRIFILQIS